MKPTSVPTDSRYVPLTQQRWCCVPTCIQMVMLRHEIPLLSAELIGYHMGLIIPEDAKGLFWNARTGQQPPAGYGTQAGKPQYGPNAVFKKLNIPLHMTWSLISSFTSINEVISYLTERNQNNCDTLVCFDWATLFDPSSNYHNGHVCVLDQIDLERNIIRLIDPDPYAPKWREVTIEALYTAMKFHGKEKSGGFWELTKMI